MTRRSKRVLHFFFFLICSWLLETRLQRNKWKLKNYKFPNQKAKCTEDQIIAGSNRERKDYQERGISTWCPSCGCLPRRSIYIGDKWSDSCQSIPGCNWNEINAHNSVIYTPNLLIFQTPSNRWSKSPPTILHDPHRMTWPPQGQFHVVGRRAGQKQ